MTCAGAAATLAALVYVMWPAAAGAQAASPVAVGVFVAPSWDETTTLTSATTRSGVLVQGEAELVVRVVELGLMYRQGSLSGAQGSDQRDLVEGQAMLGLRPVPWLKLEAGPRARAYTTPAGTERWIFWEGRVEAAARVLRPAGWVSLKLGRSLGADLPGLVLDRGLSAEGTLQLRLGRSPLWGRLGYWMHRAETGGGQRVETMQGVSVGLALLP